MKLLFKDWPGCVPPLLSSEDGCDGVYSYPGQNMSGIYEVSTISPVLILLSDT